MAHLIHVPEPCHEDWDNMQPEANGRHCLQCCKTVVDFTGWEVDAIASYLKNAKGSTCGRFTVDQVQAPAPPGPEELAHQVIRASIPLYGKLAAMIILFFGLSVSACDAQKTNGEPVAMPHPTGDTTYVYQPPVAMMGAAPVPVYTVADTTKPLMGKPALNDRIVKGRVSVPHKTKPKPKPKPKPVTTPTRYLQGDVQIVDPPLSPQMQAPGETQGPQEKK